MSLTLLQSGPAAVLAEVADAAEVAQLHEWLQRRSLPGVRALVPAARTVLIEVEPGRLDAVRSALETFVPDAVTVGQDLRPVVEIPTVYDGDDLEAVAATLGLSIEDVIRLHSGPTYVAAFCGFSPGYAYLIGGDPALQLPRRENPRTRVPERSVAIAGEYSAVYPAASPGGWHLLGRSLVAVWDVDRDPPALIPPGTAVRFVPTDAEPHR